MYFNHFSSILSDSHDENFGLTDWNCNVGEEGIYKSKSYVETRVLARMYEVYWTQKETQHEVWHRFPEQPFDIFSQFFHQIKI